MNNVKFFISSYSIILIIWRNFTQEYFYICFIWHLIFKILISFKESILYTVDKQFGLIVTLMIIGLGLTQIQQDSDTFYIGLGWGTIAMASIWLIVKIIKDFRKK